ncbi:hypothetical protein [Solimonas flava]|uniref:hypothetical protein n=1 Tax=Solimonas flava TaxID=415849 RepID=UPI000412E153|nr:hypothetical protein [Solimonas flava]
MSKRPSALRIAALALAAAGSLALGGCVVDAPARPGVSYGYVAGSVGTAPPPAYVDDDPYGYGNAYYGGAYYGPSYYGPSYYPPSYYGGSSATYVYTRDHYYPVYRDPPRGHDHDHDNDHHHGGDDHGHGGGHGQPPPSNIPDRGGARAPWQNVWTRDRNGAGSPQQAGAGKPSRPPQQAPVRPDNGGFGSRPVRDTPRIEGRTPFSRPTPNAATAPRNERPVRMQAPEPVRNRRATVQ